MTAALRIHPASTPETTYELARQRQESAALARGRLLVETFGPAHHPDDELDAASVALYEAKLILEESRGLAAPRRRAFDGRRRAGAIEITSDSGRFVAIVADAPAAARELLGRTFGRVPAELSPVQLARDFPQFDAPTWSITEAQVRAWAEGQA